MQISCGEQYLAQDCDDFRGRESASAKLPIRCGRCRTRDVLVVHAVQLVASFALPTRSRRHILAFELIDVTLARALRVVPVGRIGLVTVEDEKEVISVDELLADARVRQLNRELLIMIMRENHTRA